VPSGVSEKSSEKNPRRLTIELARRKATAISKKYPDALVLGADTLVFCQGEILGKPKNLADSLRILRLLNGRWHAVYTGVAVSCREAGVMVSQAHLTRVKARKLDPAALAALAGKHSDKAGSYAVQDKEDPFISHIRGDMDNVIGLPLKTVRRLLALARKKVLKKKP